jgi:hypothetical protein
MWVNELPARNERRIIKMKTLYMSKIANWIVEDYYPSGDSGFESRAGFGI